MKTKAEIQEQYLEWLKGKSLRAIARKVGISHSAVQAKFQMLYGRQATDPVATSLVRSLLDDYGCTEEVLSLLPKLIGVYENTQHRSRHSINQLTRYQTATDDLMMDYLTEVASVSDDNGVTALFYSPDDQREAEDKPEPLKLPLFLLLSVTLVNLLGVLMPKKSSVANFKNKQEKTLLAS
ncbi:hypothetical protein ACE1B6_24375 [Aerosakkonemataceae cyanobacterium BLCC-F154]|uniref:Uncharacterized protein n=1 Tax=Floridaenema fluviatile BLCC-F154 TaxID=3153640 RepID=A0ABV4YHT8_9CYAN